MISPLIVTVFSNHKNRWGKLLVQNVPGTCASEFSVVNAGVGCLDVDYRCQVGRR